MSEMSMVNFRLRRRREGVTGEEGPDGIAVVAVVRRDWGGLNGR